ncbi:MAG: hypothetical protein ABIL58_21225 [Pseudomonadota bacterium]
MTVNKGHVTFSARSVSVSAFLESLSRSTGLDLYIYDAVGSVTRDFDFRQADIHQVLLSVLRDVNYAAVFKPGGSGGRLHVMVSIPSQGESPKDNSDSSDLSVVKRPGVKSGNNRAGQNRNMVSALPSRSGIPVAGGYPESYPGGAGSAGLTGGNESPGTSAPMDDATHPTLNPAGSAEAGGNPRDPRFRLQKLIDMVEQRIGTGQSDAAYEAAVKMSTGALPPVHDRDRLKFYQDSLSRFD